MISQNVNCIAQIQILILDFETGILRISHQVSHFYDNTSKLGILWVVGELSKE